MRLVINLDDYRPAATLEPLPQAQGDGKVIAVAFRELDRLEQKLERLDELPSVDGHEIGDVAVHTNGLVVSFVQVAEVDGEAEWVTLGRYNEKRLITWLLEHRSLRNRLERKIKRHRCDHAFAGKKACGKCGEPKPVKYRLCRRRPRRWTFKLSNYDRSPICRRRHGHEGDCSWEGDPGSFAQ